MPSLKSQLFVSTSILGLQSQFRGSLVLAQSTQSPADGKFRSQMMATQIVGYQRVVPSIRTSFQLTQVIQTAPEEPFMTDVIFPELRGVSWDVHLKPQFSTKIATHTSGGETRTAYWEQPIYDIELTYDYLPNYNGTNTDLKKLLGFFNNRLGSFEEFLYKMKDFNHVDDHVILVGNANTVEVVLTDEIADYVQPIGQVNSDTLTVDIQLTPQSVATGADAVLQLPYADNAVVTHVTRGVNSYAPVTGTPVGLQYKFDPTTGKLTFPIGEANQAFAITYTAQLLPTTGYTVLMPNTLVFTTAPPVNSIVSASYDYWFIVRFSDDQQDFDTFSEKLWELQELHLRTVIV